MGNNTTMIAGGLISGFGKGLENVSNRRYERENAAAADARQRALMEIARKNGNEDWANRTENTRAYDQTQKAGDRAYNEGQKVSDRAYTEDYNAGLLTDANARADKTVKEWVYNPATKMMDAVNAQGARLPGVTRALDPDEAKKFAAANGAGDGKYVNDANDDAMKQLDEDFKVEAIRTIKESGEEGSMDKFMVMGALGNMEIDTAKLKAEFPELAAKNTLEKQLTEQEIQAGRSPQAAISAARAKIKDMTDTQIKTTIIDEAVKTTGLPKTEVEQAYKLPATPKTVQQLTDAIKANPNDANVARQLKAIQAVNPELNKMYEDRILAEKGYDQRKATGTAAPGAAPAATPAEPQGMLNSPVPGAKIERTIDRGFGDFSTEDQPVDQVTLLKKAKELGITVEPMSADTNIPYSQRQSEYLARLQAAVNAQTQMVAGN